jgi:iron complex outermembrane receptor protein
LYNLLPFNATPLRPETNRAYEVGLKTTLLEKRLRMNVAAFWTEAANLQVQQSISTGTVIAVFSTNAAKARSRGVDFDAEMLVTPALTATFSFAVLDGKYTQFPGAPSSINNRFLVPATGANGNPILIVPGCTLAATTNLDPANGGNVNNCPVDATGNRLPRAPTITGTLGLNYHMGASFGGGFDVSGYVSYNDGYYFLADNKLKQPSYTILNGSLRYTFANDRSAIQLWGKNLTDEEYYAYTSQFAGSLGDATVPAEPRTYGIQFSTRF